MSIGIVISTSIRGLLKAQRVLVFNAGCGIGRTYIVVVGRNARICIDSIRDIGLSQGTIIQSRIPLCSRALCCCELHVLVYR